MPQKTKEEFPKLKSPISHLCRKELLDKKIKEHEKISDVIEMPIVVFFPEKCFSMPKLLYFLRKSTCFLEKHFLERYDKLKRNYLCKATKVRKNENQF